MSLRKRDTCSLCAPTGVFATKFFTARSVLCDYHGKLESGAEGRRLVAQLQPGQASYVFFFKFNDQEHCINAQAEYCVCHPQFITFGRMINHSSKRDNVKGLVVKMSIQTQDRPVFLIVAKRDINPGEELLIDYGVTRKSYGGEAMELSWLDD